MQIRKDYVKMVEELQTFIDFKLFEAAYKLGAANTEPVKISNLAEEVLILHPGDSLEIPVSNADLKFLSEKLEAIQKRYNYYAIQNCRECVSPGSCKFKCEADPFNEDFNKCVKIVRMST